MAYYKAQLKSNADFTTGFIQTNCN